MIKGITPIDAAFEVMGLVQAGNIMRFLFIETFIGKAAFAIGFVLSLKGALDTGNMRLVLIYVLVFFCAWFLVVMPRVKIGNTMSAMEENGLKAGTTQEILKNNGYSEQDTVLILNVFSDVLTGFTRGLVVVIERIQKNATTYLKEPMAQSRLVIKTRKALEAGIVDAKLRERAVWFCQDHFWPAMRRLEESGRGTSERAWPGATDVMSEYTIEEKEKWRGLAQDLFLMLEKDGQIFSNMFDVFNGYEDKVVAQEQVLKALFKTEFSKHAHEYAVKSWRMKKKQFFVQGSVEDSSVGRQSKAEWVFENSAWVQGVLLFYGYSLFPVVLGVSMMLRNVGMMGVYALFLVLMRGMSVMWALVDQTAKVFFDIVGKRGEVLPWNMTQVNECVALLMVALPIVTSVAVLAGMMRKRKSQQEDRR